MPTAAPPIVSTDRPETTSTSAHAPALVRIGEATRITGLAEQTLYKLARQRKIRSFRVLRRAVRFDRDDLLALVEELK